MPHLKRIAVILAFGIFLSLLSNSFIAVDITERAIAVGLAIDLKDDVVVTAEIIAAGGGQQQVGIFTKLVRGEGKTVAEAVSTISEELGKEMSLGQTQVLLIGENALKKMTADDLFSFFDVSPTFKDGTSILTCRGEASDLFSVTSVSSNSASFALVAMLGRLHWQVVPSNVMLNFLEQLDNVSHSSFLPIVELQKVEQTEQQNSPTEAYVYALSSVAVFKDDKYLCELSPSAVKGFSLLFKDFTGQSFVVGYDGEKQGYFPPQATLTVVDKKADVQTKDDDVVSVKLKLDVRQILADDFSEGVAFRPKKYPEVTTSMKDQAIALCKQSIDDFFAECVDGGVDLLGVCKKFYAQGGRQWKEKGISPRQFVYSYTVEMSE